MEYQKTFERLNETPAVDPKLQDKIQEHFRNLRRIDICRMVGNKARKVNGLRFREDTNGHPEEDTVEIAEAVVACAEYDVEQKGSVAKYRAILYLRDPSNGSERKIRVSFQPESEYDEDETRGSGGHGGVHDKAFDMAKDAMMTGRNELLAFAAIQNEHILQLQDRLLDHSKTSASVVSKLQEMLEAAHSRVEEAYAAKDRALAVIYSAKTAEVEAEAKMKKDELLAQALKAALPILATSVGIAAKKYGMPAPEVEWDDDEEDEEDEEDEKDEDFSEDETSEEHQKAEAEAEIQSQMKKTPVLFLLTTLKDSIEKEQWAKIADALSKKHFKLLRTALDQETEAATVMEVQKLGMAALTKPAIVDKLKEVLTEDQVTCITQAFQIAVATSEKHAAENAEDPPVSREGKKKATKKNSKKKASKKSSKAKDSSEEG